MVSDLPSRHDRPPSATPISAVIGSFLIGVLYFCVLTPAALVIRLTGRDALRLRLDPGAPSYWIRKRGPRISMKRPP